MPAAPADYYPVCLLLDAVDICNAAAEEEATLFILLCILEDKDEELRNFVMYLSQHVFACMPMWTVKGGKGINPFLRVVITS